MIKLSKKWCDWLLSQPETGMDYQIVTIVLEDGRRFEQVVAAGGFLTSIRGLAAFPFQEDEIREIIVTHDKYLN